MSNQQPEENENLLSSIASTVEMIRGQMVTKDDIEHLVTKEEFEPVSKQVEFLGGQLEDIRDRMATKSDLAKLEDRLEVETTAIRGDIERVHLRLDGIEKLSRRDSVRSRPR